MSQIKLEEEFQQVVKNLKKEKRKEILLRIMALPVLTGIYLAIPMTMLIFVMTVFQQAKTWGHQYSDVKTVKIETVKNK